MTNGIDTATIPAALTARDQWVVWRSEERSGKLTKVPYNAQTGDLAATDNPATWVAYTAALKVYKRGGYSGIGYVFSDDDPYTGIDLDDCIDQEGNLAPWADTLLQSLNSYSEISPSERGIKVWVIGSIPSSVHPRKDKIPDTLIPKDQPGRIELYNTRRFFTVTGWHVQGVPADPKPANGILTQLYQQLKPELPSLPEPAHTTRLPGRKYLERWAQHKIDYAVDRVRSATDGERHNERYAMARLLGGLIPHSLATEDQIARALFDAQPPKTQAQHSERKTILDGIQRGSQSALPLPDAPDQPSYDPAGFACCPKHKRVLDAAKSGNGYTCHARDSSTERGWCTFWWDGDGYSAPKPIDPETGEVLDSTSSDILLNAHRSDTGNAECLIALYGDDLRFCHTRHKWLSWDGSRWIIDEDGAALRSMIAVVGARFHACTAIEDLDQRKKAAAWCIGCEGNDKMRSALNVAGSLEAFSTTVAKYDRDPFVAAAIGATIDLRAVMHRAVSRDDFLTMHLGATYDPEATCPRWLQFLDEVFAGNAELIAFIQRAAGYCLTGDTREQCLFLCHGLGMNGKSVFLSVLMKLLGDYADNASFETFDADRRNESSNDLAKLRGKRLVTVIETEQGKRLAEARVKAVTGQDTISCRFLYGEYFTYRPAFKIWLAMNHLPVIRGTDKGIWRRIRLIPFSQDFEDRQDKTLETALEQELDGILQWALEGLRQWNQRGLDTPSIVNENTARYRADSDQIGRWMNENCVQVSSVSMTVAQAYQNYKTWCEGTGETPVSQTKLGRTLKEKGFDQASPGNTRTWIGIGLRADPAESPPS